MSSSSRIGIALSGGGYRATAFHLGTLKKLQEMQILDKASVISTISGGSITGAYYCLNKDDFDSFEKSLYSKLQTKNVIRKVLLSWTTFQAALFVLGFPALTLYFLFSGKPWLVLGALVLFIILFLKFQFYIFPVSNRIEKIYDEFFYHGKSLGDLPDSPVLVVGSTNMQTARPFIFSKNRMQDSTYQYMTPSISFKSDCFPVARAVMASSCVPGAFTPIHISKKFFTNPEDANRVHPILVDGGVYDNQGIHKITQSGQYACDTVITSDAGTGGSGEVKFSNAITLLSATVNLFMSRIKKSQMVQDVYNNAATAQRQIAYLSLGWDVENCIPGFVRNLISGQITPAVIAAHALKPEWVADPKQYEEVITDYLKARTGYASIDKPTDEEKKIARGVGTNLTALSKSQVDCLMKQAQALTEIQIKLYCPLIVN
ncbi:MAG: patatin-like phospholipase family protein [Chitinophagaceae bacterium]|nr:patatin-like phospholipase family protein [Chitinophagaceae bacterium]